MNYWISIPTVELVIVDNLVLGSADGLLSLYVEVHSVAHLDIGLRRLSKAKGL